MPSALEELATMEKNSGETFHGDFLGFTVSELASEVAYREANWDEDHKRLAAWLDTATPEQLNEVARIAMNELLEDLPQSWLSYVIDNATDAAKP